MPNPRSTAAFAGHPLHAMLVQFPVVCFVLTLLSDIVYATTAQMQWTNMSAWLLLIGLVVAVFAVLAGVVDFLRDRRVRELRGMWIHVIGYAIALVLAILNAFIHSRDAYTSVVPVGLTLSILTVLIMVVTSWFGWSLGYRRAVIVESEAR